MQVAGERVPVLRLGRDAGWFEPPGGERVECVRYPLLRRLLSTLIEARVATPGIALPRERLIAAGWPGEQMSTAAARNRINVALARLRRLGLEGWLVHQSGAGFLLVEELVVHHVSDG